MIRKLLSAAALVCAALPAAAGAEVFVASFQAGPVTDVYRPPYGVTIGTVFTGDLRYDSATSTLLGFTFVAPEGSFGLTDVQSFNVLAFNSAIQQFSVDFGRGFISSNNTVVVRQDEDPSGYAFCNDCVTFTSSIAAVPEPSTWAMLIVGFGAVGAAARKRSPLRSSRISRA